MIKDEDRELRKQRSRICDLDDQQLYGMTDREFYNDCFPLKSPWLTADRYRIPADTDSQARENLNLHIRSFFRPEFIRSSEAGTDACYEDLYKAMQNFRDGYAFNNDSRMSEERFSEMFGQARYPRWNFLVNASYHFSYLQFLKREAPDSRWWDDSSLDTSSKIKAYLTSADDDYLEIFLEAVRFLADGCWEQFCAKVSRQRRVDHMCFWISPRDFYLLEEFVKRNEDRFVKAMPFVPYSGKIGITMEFMGCTPGSYNEGIALMLFAYVNSVRDKSEMTAEDMYDRMMRMKTSRSYEGDPGFPDWRGSFEKGTCISSGSRILLLESIDHVLRNKAPDRNSFIFKAAGKYHPEWRVLAFDNYQSSRTRYLRSQYRESLWNWNS